MAPNRYTVRLHAAVERDLEAIHRYVSYDSEANASGLIAKILLAIDSLALFSHRYPVFRDDPRPTRVVRRMPIGNYAVFYRVNDSNLAVNVIHVRHGARRPPSRFPR